MEKKFIVDFIEYLEDTVDGEMYLSEPFNGTAISDASEENRKYMISVNENVKALDYLYKTGIMNDIAEKVDSEIFDDGEGKLEVVGFMIDPEKLMPYLDELKKKFPLSWLDEAIDRQACWVSGCISVIGNMGTYRDNCGCVSKSWELRCLHGYNYRIISEISDIYRTEGNESAGKKIIDMCLHK